MNLSRDYFTLPAGTKLYHGSPEPFASNIKKSGKLLGRSSVKLGRGLLCEGGLVWFAKTPEIAKAWAEGLEADKEDFEKEGEVFQFILEESLRIVPVYKELTQEEADKLTKVLYLPAYKRLLEGDRIYIAAHRAYENSAHRFPSYKTQRGEMVEIYPTLLDALGAEGIEYNFITYGLNSNKISMDVEVMDD